MDRYQNLDLDLECDGGVAAQKPVLFRGMFKRSSKSGDQPVHTQQDSLSTDSELSKSDESLNDSNNTKNKVGLFKGIFKKNKASNEDQPQAAPLSLTPELSDSSESLTDGRHFSKDKANSPKPEHVPRPSQESGGVFNGMLRKLQRPFAARTQPQDQCEPSELSGSSDGRSVHGNTEVENKTMQQETKRSETPPVLPRPAPEENKDVNPRQKTEGPGVLPSSSEEDLQREVKLVLPKDNNHVQAESDQKRFKEEKSSSREEKKKEETPEKAEKVNVIKPKKQNPFMPQVKAKLIQRSVQDGAADVRAENEGGSRSLFDQLDDLCTDPAEPGHVQEVEDLMEWWRTVESWEDAPEDGDMTEKEEAKAFALTADKVQRGIRVFNKLFSERAESLWQHVLDLHSIADGLDKFHKNTKIAQITGGSTSAVGGIATIAGLALAPMTLGTSLIVTAVGLGVATAGGLTSAGAGISNQVNNSMDRKKVEKIVEDYQEKILDLNKCLKFIQQGIEHLRRFDLIKMKKHAYNRDFPVLSSSLYEDGAMAGKAILSNANEIMRVVQIAHVAGSTAARAVQVASMATGVLTGLFVGMDIYFVAKDSKELKKGAKSEFAAKIREVATQLHDGLVELNGIRVELQSGTQGTDAARDKAVTDGKQKEGDEISGLKKTRDKLQ